MGSEDRVSGANPLEPIPSFVIAGLPLVVIADLPSGGFINVIVGDNPLAIATPGPQLPKGCMLALLVPPYTDQIRPSLRKAHSEALKSAASGRVIQLAPGSRGGRPE